jgi:HD-GYP domain-containing protein (c-di-GMP phosphodiesterase class II)
MKTTLYEKSQETEEHAQRLIQLSRQIGQVMQLSDKQLNELELLSTLHDIGKIGISDTILNKTGKLTEGEWVEMKKHPEIGYRIAMS